jgi:MFS transporter, DHA2 family, multidrug resistance protein
MLTTRIGYHSQQYGGAIKQGSEIYQQTLNRIRFHIQNDAGGSPAASTRQSQALMLSNMNKQAYIQGVNDDFLLAGIITLLGVIPITFLHTKKQKIQKSPENG